MSFSAPLVLLLLIPVIGGAVWAWLGRRHGLGGRRRFLSLALRLLIFLALILALAGLTWQRPRSAQAVVFVGDLSASTRAGQNDMMRFINQALQMRGHDDRVALVAMGKQALVEQPPAALSNFSGFSSLVDYTYTNIEAGLGLGAALLPTGYRRRVVAITDGRQNLGDAVSEARLLHAEGIRVDVAPITITPGPDVRVDGVDVPGSLHVGERFSLTVRLTSTVATRTAIQITADNQVIYSGSAQVPVGSSVLTYPVTARGAGVHTYNVTIQPADDTIPHNNGGSAFATVLGPPRVLVVEGAPGFGVNVVAALRAGKIATDTVEAYQMPPDLAGLQKYAAVVLVDASADLLGPDATSALRSYVQDLGRGLVVLGGVNSYGVGGYGGTPLEDVLPVKMELPKRKDLPTAAVVLVVESLESDLNVNISKQAAKGVIGLLTPEDMIAVSDANAGLVVPLQHVTNRVAIDGAIDAMDPGDPITYADYLNQAYNVLKSAKAQTKHIILLGDGDAQDDYQPLIKKIAKAGIQISTIETNAVTPDEFQTMKDIARWGNGHYYPADNIATIPQVFLKVARTVAHTSIIEGKFYPAQDAASSILDGINAVPPLDGYVVTTPKPLSTVVLASPKSDPILAQWQYGLGRAVAWTSDSQGRWTASWLANPGTKHIWASMVNWVLPPPQSASLSLSASAAGGIATIGVDTLDGANYRSITARVVDPTNSAQTVTLQPTAPNHYEAQIQAGQEGAYLIDVQAARTGNIAVRSASGGLVVPYAPDYRDSGPDPTTMQAIAAAGGGSVISRPAQAFADNLPPVDAPTPLQTPLLLFALLLLPLDVAVRRLVLGREDWQALLAALPRRRSAVTGSGQPAFAPLAGLRTRRATRPGVARAAAPISQTTAPVTHRAGTETETAPAIGTGVARPSLQGLRARRSAARQQAQPSSIPAAGLPAAQVDEAPRATPAPVPAPSRAEPGASSTSRLLDAKRRRRTP
ncbi:MAG TPA: VWA domain-containing protein [Chloroflexota bacterium]|nr:VWA domain-containing protein [Chloroflexota bacterium]